MIALKLEKLSIGYTHNRQSLPVVGVIDTELHRGELVALVGANGAGKSTLLRTISAFQKPLGGSIVYPDGISKWRTSAQLATLLSVVLTGNDNISNLTVEEVVSLGRMPYTNFMGHIRKCDKDIVEQSMQQVNIAQMAHRRIETLSDGERQKTMIAKALAQETPVILLDEPTAFLDFCSRVQLFALLRQLAHETGKAILVSSHDLELVLRMADKLWLIHNKQIHTGSVEQLAASGILNAFIDAEGISYNAIKNIIEIK